MVSTNGFVMHSRAGLLLWLVVSLVPLTLINGKRDVAQNVFAPDSEEGQTTGTTDPSPPPHVADAFIEQTDEELMSHQQESVLNGNVTKVRRHKLKRTVNRVMRNESSYVAEVATDFFLAEFKPGMCPPEVMKTAYYFSNRMFNQNSAGGFGVVKRATLKDTEQGVSAVVAKISKSERRTASITSEELQIGQLTLPFILGNRDVSFNVAGVTTQELIVMPAASGGELFDYIADSGALDAATVRRIGAQLVFGLWSLHSKGWMTRDIKPENMLMYSDKKGAERVTHIDFGFAQHCPESDPACGTEPPCPGCTPAMAMYGAPHFRRGLDNLREGKPFGVKHGREVDWFSVHATMFVAASGLGLCGDIYQCEGPSPKYRYHLIKQKVPKAEGLRNYLSIMLEPVPYEMLKLKFWNRAEVTKIHKWQNIHKHPVLGHDFWFGDSFLKELGIPKPWPKKKGEKIKKEVWMKVCELYAEDPCICQHLCYATCSQAWKSNEADIKSNRKLLESYRRNSSDTDEKCEPPSAWCDLHKERLPQVSMCSTCCEYVTAQDGKKTSFQKDNEKVLVEGCGKVQVQVVVEPVEETHWTKKVGQWFSNLFKKKA